MKKAKILLLFLLILGIAGCGAQKDEDDLFLESEEETTEATAQDQTDEKQTSIDDVLALTAIKNYCYINNPDLKSIEDSGKAPVYWNISSSDDSEIVVMFRSYTGAQIRYYIDRATGDTYVTEFVPGITEAEEKTDESFNLKDYADGEIVNVYEVTDLNASEDGSEGEEPAEDQFATIVRYFEMADGTWRTKFHSYQYRLEITGRVDGMDKDNTLVFLSNIEDIPFDQAVKAAGMSSTYELNNEDAFDPKDAVLVAIK